MKIEIEKIKREFIFEKRIVFQRSTLLFAQIIREFIKRKAMLKTKRILKSFLLLNMFANFSNLNEEPMKYK